MARPQQQSQMSQRKVRIPIVGSAQNRQTNPNKDQRFVNLFPESIKTPINNAQKIYLVKRAGLELSSNFQKKVTYKHIPYIAVFSGFVMEVPSTDGIVYGTTVTISNSTGVLASGDYTITNVNPATNKVTVAGTFTAESSVFLDAEFTLTYSTIEGRGIWYFNGNTYSIFKDTIYKDGVAIQTMNTSTGVCGAIEATGDTKYLFICDGTDGWIVDNTGTIKPVVPQNTWTATTTYTTGSRIKPTVDNSLWYVMVDPPAWQASKIYSLGNIVKPTANDNYWYKVTVAGTADVTEPIWPTTIGNTVVNGTVTFTTIAANSGNSGGSEPTWNKTIGGYTYDNNVPWVGYASGFPSPHVPTPVFIDGYVLLIQKNTADIYNSALNDPFSWPPTDFITAELYPDDLRSLARQNNQVVAMGVTSTEFFFDAANSSGSPLARNDAAALQFGTCAPYAVFQNEKFCILVGQSASGGRAIWEVDGFTPKKISTEYIEKIIDAEGADIEKATSFGVRVQGHLFYVLNLYTQSRTLVYDLEERMWHEWSSNDGSGNHICFGGSFVADDESGKVFVQHLSNGKIYRLSPTQYSDDGSSIICDAVTTKLDFDTMDRKFISNMNIVGDISDATTTPITFRWSDDDYKTWSNWKTLDMSAARMFFTRLGAFRRRAFQFKYIDNYPCRLEAVEFELYAGNT